MASDNSITSPHFGHLIVSFVTKIPQLTANALKKVSISGSYAHTLSTCIPVYKFNTYRQSCFSPIIQLIRFTKGYGFFEAIRFLLVISEGCSIPNRYKTVGAMSERMPFSLNFIFL